MISFVPSCSASLIFRAASFAGLFILLSVPFLFSGEAGIMIHADIRQFSRVGVKKKYFSRTDYCHTTQ